VGPIRSWADFEAYPWPRVEDVDFSDIEWYERNLPDEMAMTCMTYLFQKVSDLIGFAPMCTMLYDQPDLVKAVTEKVGAFYEQYARGLCRFSRFAAINVGDDMGHKHSTLIAPEDIREIFIPWHRRIIGAAHEQGKLGFFHTCGRVDAIMDDLIETVRADAHHSTQDVVMPITEMKHRYGERIALLGGIDVDVLTRARVEEVRPYVRHILEQCMPGGGFALGVGNWVAASMPLENYLAVLEEARSFR